MGLTMVPMLPLPLPARELTSSSAMASMTRCCACSVGPWMAAVKPSFQACTGQGYRPPARPVLRRRCRLLLHCSKSEVLRLHGVLQLLFLVLLLVLLLRWLPHLAALLPMPLPMPQTLNHRSCITSLLQA